MKAEAPKRPSGEMGQIAYMQDTKQRNMAYAREQRSPRVNGPEIIDLAEEDLMSRSPIPPAAKLKRDAELHPPPSIAKRVE